MEATSVQKRKNCVMDEEEGALGSSSADSSGNSTGSSASSDLTDDTASSSSSSSPPSSSSCSPPPRSRGPLFEMSTLREQLPFKRGLSKFYQGKSQSFASFSDIKSFEDLVKPERRPLKRLKTSRSCGEGWDGSGSLLNLECCGRRRVITRRDPKSSSLSSSAGARRRVCSLASRPPLHPRRPSNSDQPLWFA